LFGKAETLDPTATRLEIAIDVDLDTIHILDRGKTVQNAVRQSREMDRI
jgi:hypothetical protein